MRKPKMVLSLIGILLILISVYINYEGFYTISTIKRSGIDNSVLSLSNELQDTVIMQQYEKDDVIIFVLSDHNDPNKNKVLGYSKNTLTGRYKNIENLFLEDLRTIGSLETANNMYVYEITEENNGFKIYIKHKSSIRINYLGFSFVVGVLVLSYSFIKKGEENA